MSNPVYTSPYKGYVFVNTALSSSQKGVQGAHVLVEIFNKMLLITPQHEKATENLINWIKNDKTLIFLDGGFNRGLRDNYETFRSYCFKLNLPCAIFTEDEDTMNGMTTAFAGIIPDSITNITDMDAALANIAHFSHIHSGIPPIRYIENQLGVFVKGFKLAI